MTFCIITHVPHSQSNGSFFGYAPYVNEMNVWIKNAAKVIIVAPLKSYPKTAIHESYFHNNIQFIAVPDFSLLGFFAVCRTIFYLPKIIFSIFNAMQQSDHIHLRCPGNTGLLGSLVQILFPNTKKTAKYAGNWDASSKQPLSYQFQKFILSSTLLSKNMQVLVYGAWKNQSKNIKSFFTATYSEDEKTAVIAKSLNGKIELLFVGSLTAGKQPLVAVQITQHLLAMHFDVALSIYGEGSEKENLVQYIATHKLAGIVSLNGTINREVMKKVYQMSHFLILPSKSEGWPKVIAEAMFWGCLPIATPISCVPNMLDYGRRGILLSNSMEHDSALIQEMLNNQALYDLKIKEALHWSRNFTIDKFDQEVKKILSS